MAQTNSWAAEGPDGYVVGQAPVQWLAGEGETLGLNLGASWPTSCCRVVVAAAAGAADAVVAAVAADRENSAADDSCVVQVVQPSAGILHCQ
jgi:hypothetical protein